MGRGKRRGALAARPQAVGTLGARGPVLSGVSKEERALVAQIRTVLAARDDLRRPPWAGDANPMAGHCYVASEVFYHLQGGKAAAWKPVGVQHEGGPHWWLENADGRRVDITADQFSSPVAYEKGRGQGFLTRQPSKRAQLVIDTLSAQ
jgi:hypothetical protein